MKGQSTKRTFVVYVEDKPGVLNRVSSLFRRRNFNIDSLNVGTTNEAGVSRMTVVCDADGDTARRIEANLYKLVNCLYVDDITDKPSINRLLALVKVKVSADTRTEILQLGERFQARVVDDGAESLVFEISDTTDQVGSLVKLLEPFGIAELVQTGIVSMTRGPFHHISGPPTLST